MNTPRPAIEAGRNRGREVGANRPSTDPAGEKEHDRLGSASRPLILLSSEGCHRLPSVDELVAELQAAGFELVRRERLIPGDAVWGIAARNNVAGGVPGVLGRR